MKWLLGLCLLGLRLIAAPVTIATYNLEFYVDLPTLGVPPKTPEARQLIREGIKRIRPDILALQEVGSRAAFDELRASLKAEGLDYRDAEYVRASDGNLHLAFLTRWPILARRSHTNESFLFQGRRYRVSRGFGEIEIAVGGERLTLITTHLKSKRQVGEADQQGLREEESLLLREKIDDFFNREPGGNLVVLGDLNDDISSKAVRTVLGRGRNRLFDVRPSEQNGDTLPHPNPRYDPRRVVWTHFFGRDEIFTRVDYIFLSPSLQRIVDSAGTYVLALPNWGTASDHRPLCVRLKLPD